MKYEQLIYEKANNIATITLNRPQVLNSITLQMVAELTDAVTTADKDDDVRVIIITGAGRGFCAGDDIGNVFGTDEKPGAAQAFKTREQQLSYLEKDRLYSGAGILLDINKPTIAAVNGVAVGYGCTVALLCDIRIASEKARFAELFINVGIIPGEGLFQLPRIVGLGRAYELLLTGDIIDAAEAHRIGLVNKVVPPDQLMNEAVALATRIAQKAPMAIRLSKEGIRKGLNGPDDDFYQWKSLAQLFLMMSEDHLEASKAFLEKRKPVFKGK